MNAKKSVFAHIFAKFEYFLRNEIHFLRLAFIFFVRFLKDPQETVLMRIYNSLCWFCNFNHAEQELIPCIIEILEQNFLGGILYFFLISVSLEGKSLPLPVHRSVHISRKDADELRKVKYNVSQICRIYLSREIRHSNLQNSVCAYSVSFSCYSSRPVAR